MQLALSEIKGISTALAGIKVTVEQTADACVKIQDMATRIQDSCTKQCQPVRNVKKRTAIYFVDVVTKNNNLEFNIY